MALNLSNPLQAGQSIASTALNKISQATTGATTSRGQTTTSGGGGGVSLATQAVDLRDALNIRASNIAASSAIKIQSILAGSFGSSHTITPLPDPPASKLDLDVSVNNYKPIDVAGFSEQRPEIIAVFNFAPVFDDKMLQLTPGSQIGVTSPVGDMLDVQMSARQLRAENILRLMNELQADDKIAPLVKQLEQRLKQVEGEIETETKFLYEMIQKLAAAKLTLSIKLDSQRIRSDMATRDPMTPDVDPIRDIFINQLKFTPDGYNSFTNTKILLQLLDDLRNAIGTYSFQLVDATDPRRDADVDPTSIIKYNDTLLFNIASLESPSMNDISTILTRTGLEKFLNSIQLLSTSDDRLKLLFAVLSKELRVSAGLSIPTVRTTITRAFGLDDKQIDNKVFDRIIGIAGNSIFDPPTLAFPTDARFINGRAQIETTQAKNSLMGLLNIRSGESRVFPFESTFIRQPTGDTIVPGQKFYIDSIIQGPTKFDTDPINNFSTVFGTALKSFATVVEGTLDVNVINQNDLGLLPNQMMDTFLKAVNVAVGEIQTAALGGEAFFLDESPAASRDTFTPALLHAAADDVVLKELLALYVCEAGTVLARQPGAKSPFFSALNYIVQHTIAKPSDSSPFAIAAMSIGSTVDNRPQSYTSEAGISDPNNDEISRILTIGRSPRTVDGVNDGGLNKISAVITARLLAQQATQNRPAGSFEGLANSIDEVVEYRVFDKLASIGVGDPGFLLKAIVDLINTWDLSARSVIPGSGNYYSTENTGLTKFNGIGLHTIVWMVIEIFTTFFKAFPIATFRGASITSGRNGRIFSIFRDADLINELKQALGQVIPPSGLIAVRLTNLGSSMFLDDASRERGSRIQSIVDRLVAIKNKFIAEDVVIKRMTNALVAIGNGVQATGADLVRFFDQKGPNAAALNSVLSSSGSNEKLSALDVAQVSLARNALFEQQAASQNEATVSADNTGITDASLSPFIDDTAVPASVRAALFSMLRQPTFVSPAADHLRILSVALPAGFMASLHERLGTFNVGQNFAVFSQQSKIQDDVVKVHVYMQDLLFEDLVFKPQTFVFETGRFIAASDFSSVTANDVRDFNVLVSEAIKTRALSVDGTAFITELGNSIAADASYNGVITSDEKQQMAKNHVISYLLKVYLRLLTGIDLVEDNFYLNDSIADLRVDPETQKIFEQILTTRVSGFANKKITLDDLKADNEDVANLLSRLGQDDVTGTVIDPLKKVLKAASDAVNIELSDDLVSFMKVFSPKAILFGAGARKIRTTSPKLFERIFHIPVNPSDFVVDQDLTNSTASGRAFMQSAMASKLFTQLGFAGSVDYTPPIESQRLPIDKFNPIKFNMSIRKQLGNLSLQQFFIVIEQLPELPPIPAAAKPAVVPRGLIQLQRPTPQLKQLPAGFEAGFAPSIKTRPIFDATQPQTNDPSSEPFYWRDIL